MLTCRIIHKAKKFSVTLTGEYPVMVSYPVGLQQDDMVRLPLGRFGIESFYLTVRFRPSEAI
jgi:hypothetical protein